MTTSTFFALLAEFGSAEIPLTVMCEKYFELKPEEAKRKAALNRLPVPAHRLGGQKSPWMVHAADLAKHIDERRAAAEVEWKKSKAA